MYVHYKGKKVGSKRVDFVVDEVMVEIKAKSVLEDVAFVQTLSYLKASAQSRTVDQLWSSQATGQAIGELRKHLNH
jgi:GxxExxY protein